MELSGKVFEVLPEQQGEGRVAFRVFSHFLQKLRSGT